MKAFPKVFQMTFDLLFRSSDREGDLFRGMRAFLQKRADLTPYRFFFFDGGWRLRVQLATHSFSYRRGTRNVPVRTSTAFPAMRTLSPATSHTSSPPRRLT